MGIEILEQKAALAAERDRAGTYGDSLFVDLSRLAKPTVSAGRLGFENAYALAMPRALAEQLGVLTISDLAVHA